ncbi:MAG: DUF4331 family protein [Pirellulaceae bacterium]
MKKRLFGGSLVPLLFFASILPELARGSDHLDAPSITIDGRMDINDTYIFQSTDAPSSTAMIMTVNPLAGILSPTTFSTQTSYQFEIDRNGDAVPDLTLVVRFGALNRLTGRQHVTVRYRFGTSDIVAGIGLTGQDIPLRGGGRLRADLFDDPFFFDLLGFNDGFNFTGMDFFEGFNVSGIVVEMPRQRVSNSNNVSLVGRTLANGMQKDRVGRPAINTVLIPSGMKDKFNQSAPSNDFANYGSTVEARIEALSGDPDLAAMLTMVLLPDVLTFDQSSSAGFLNGRKLDDDVIDAELNLLTKGAVTTDMVDANDLMFTSQFPFLAPPH